MMSNDIQKKNGKVSWVIFAWTIGVILFLFSIVFTSIGSTNSKIETTITDISGIKEDISSIKTDVVWIKQALGGSK